MSASLAAVLAVLAVVAVCGLATAPSGRAAARCPAVTFIGARGSGESSVGHDGVGPAVDEMAHVMQAALARRHIGMRIEYVHYPADSVNDFVPSKAEIAMERGVGLPLFLPYYYEHNVSRFLRSINRGVRDGIRRLRRTCPSSSVALAGYSQGAMVIHQVEQQLSVVGTPGAHALDRVAATLLLADGDRVPHTQAVRLGTAAARGEGIRPWFYGNRSLRPLMQGFVARDVPMPARTVSICDAGDLICDFNFGHVRSLGRAKHAAAVHTSYATRTSRGYRYVPQLARAAGLAAGWVAQAHRARQMRACSPPRSGPMAFPTIAVLREHATTCRVARGVASGIQSYWKDNRSLPTFVTVGRRQFGCSYRHIAKPPMTDYMIADCGTGAAKVTMDLES